jgi:serine-type D-Ala-D-Ala carboxypeptidase/endopeptidase (penicillin-binding protein 4)
MRSASLLLLFPVLLSACSVTRVIHQSAQKIVLQDSVLQNAHVGISIYEPSTGRWWYNWQGDKFFVPASNTKIATCYAAMKYLGDSLVGIRYIVAKDGAVELFPSGDPTFLHPDFARQPVYTFLKQKRHVRWDLSGWQDQRWGSGWSWNDFDAAYMAERSPLPVYGNVTKAWLQDDKLTLLPAPEKIWYDTASGYSPQTSRIQAQSFRLERELDANVFYLKNVAQRFTTSYFPIRMDVPFVSKLLKDTLHAKNVSAFTVAPDYQYSTAKTVIHSQPTDSLLRLMMHRSDNFFAEQSLLMVSNEVLGYMSDEKIIDTILKTAFKDLPQKPRWVDGSGLSRYNLFTPRDFIIILQKMKTEFWMDRLRDIFPAGGEGTLANFYKSDQPYLYAKTGTLSGVVALSGYLTTAKGKELIVSILVNNHRSGAVQVRRVVEQFLQNLRTQY